MAMGWSIVASKRVVIVYKTLPHYRVDFYNLLRERLGRAGVVLDLVVGQPDSLMGQRNDTAVVDWALQIRNRYISLGKRQVVWQPCIGHVRKADLVIVEQASRLLVNYPLHVARRLGGPKLGLWGHGVNLDSTARSRVGEFAKRLLVKRADWWFCYTEGTKRIVVNSGFSARRATVVQNAIDTTSLQRARAEVAPEAQQELRRRLGIGSGPVCLWLSSIYPTKRPEFMVAAFQEIRRLVPDAELLVVGDGPLRRVFDGAAETQPGVHVVGALFGKEMVEHASLASVIVNPGLVGLTVLDAFALELPMVTCALDLHSPEVEYLVDGENGLILPEDVLPADYGGAVAALLQDRQHLDKLRAGCRMGALRFTVEEMADRFAGGVLAALQS